jgi:hypothetical protein
VAYARARSSIAGDASVAMTRWPASTRKAGQQPAPAAELDDKPVALPDRRQQLEDAGGAVVGMEPEPEVVDEREVRSVRGPAGLRDGAILPSDGAPVEPATMS